MLNLRNFIEIQAKTTFFTHAGVNAFCVLQQNPKHKIHFKRKLGDFPVATL